MKEILEKLFNNYTLTAEEARKILKDIAAQKYNNCQVAAFLTVFRMRPLEAEELSGFRNALLDLCVKVDLSDYNPIDIVGTGGDQKNTFNISTLAAFVAAGAGVKVAKHGNYGVSSVCGSSNVLEALGVNLNGDADALKHDLDSAGICFLHAPLFHPAMKHVAPVRKELGIRTFFNILGPLVNPVRPKGQLLGVSGLELAELYSELLQQDSINYVIVHSLDGYDEVSLTGPFKVISNGAEKVYEPSELGFDQVDPAELQGGDTVASAAAVFKRIIEGQGSKSQNQVVIANAGLAICCANPQLELSTCFEMARESLESGKALAVLERLVA